MGAVPHWLRIKQETPHEDQDQDSRRHVAVQLTLAIQTAESEQAATTFSELPGAAVARKYTMKIKTRIRAGWWPYY
jgi:hypothetical protein